MKSLNLDLVKIPVLRSNGWGFEEPIAPKVWFRDGISLVLVLQAREEVVPDEVVREGLRSHGLPELFLVGFSGLVGASRSPRTLVASDSLCILSFFVEIDSSLFISNRAENP